MNLRESLVANNSIKLHQSVSNWEEAIKIGTDMLEASNVITPDYYQAIVKSIKDLGPYIILAPGLAMPHARPEQGVNQTGFALVTFDTPITFEGEDEPVSMMITLAGSDGDEHMEGLMQITQVLDDENSDTGVNIEKFLACSSTEDVLAVIDAALAE